MRLQMLGVVAGDYGFGPTPGNISAGALTGFVAYPGTPDGRAAIAFDTGRITISPNPLAADERITIEWLDAGGDATGSRVGIGTLEGEYVELHPPPPKSAIFPISQEASSPGSIAKIA